MKTVTNYFLVLYKSNHFISFYYEFLFRNNIQILYINEQVNLSLADLTMSVFNCVFNFTFMLNKYKNIIYVIYVLKKWLFISMWTKSLTLCSVVWETWHCTWHHLEIRKVPRIELIFSQFKKKYMLHFCCCSTYL